MTRKLHSSRPKAARADVADVASRGFDMAREWQNYKAFAQGARTGKTAIAREAAEVDRQTAWCRLETLADEILTECAKG